MPLLLMLHMRYQMSETGSIPQTFCFFLPFPAIS